MKPAIKIKLSRKEVEELVKMYSYYLSTFAIPDELDSLNDHRQLLLEHMSSMYSALYHRAIQMISGGQFKCTYKLRPVEALAFYQLWQLIDTSPFVAGNLIICRIIGQIDKASKNTRILQPQNIDL